MPRRQLSSFVRRLKHTLLATLFVGTQIVFPLSLSGLAHAAPQPNPAATLQQCRNGSLASPDLCNDSNSNTGWVSGNAGASNSHWREGDSIPYRLLFSGLSTTSSHSVTIEWETLSGVKHAIDYLTTFNRTEASTDPCFSVSGCGSASTYAIPTDTNVTSAGVTQIPGVFTLYNGTITSVTGYTVTTGSQKTTESITIDFNASDSTPVLSWGGHIASQVDWGLGNSAGAINGSSYHTYLDNLDGSGGQQDRSLDAMAVFPTPVITTQTSSASVYVGNSVTDVATLTGASSPLTGTVSFYVCGPSTTAPDCSSPGSGTAVTGNPVTITPVTTASNGVNAVSTATSGTFTPTTPGTYCFRAEYTPSSDAPYSPQSETNQSTTAPNNECFVVTIQPSTITIIKDAQPDSSQAFSYATSGGLSTDQTGFSLVDSGSGTTNTQTFNSVAPGTYTVTEQSQSGWDFKGIDCGNNANASINGATVTITITGGQSVVCTYTNAERGTLTVYKVTDPASDPTGFPVTASTTNGNIAGSANQTVTTSTPVVYDVSQGTYSVGEDLSNTPGWTQTGNTCSNVVVSADNLNASCTITNVKLAKLKIVKATDPASSTQAFNFSASGPSIDQSDNSFVLDTNSTDNTFPDNYQYGSLMPGSYSVTEQATSGWQLTGLVCDGISYSWPGNTSTLTLNLPAGADVTCTYTNTQLTSISGTKYEVNADASTVSPLQNWTIYLLVNGKVANQTTTDASGNYSFTGLLPGSYTLAEQQQAGWTQIYPFNNSIDVNLTAGNDSSANNFGNFHNAEISGYKFDDVNGNQQWDNGEPGLSGWVITLYDNGGSGALLNHQVAQTTTANDGSYSFGDLPPTTYKVCETPQTGWTQTYPDNTGCQTVDVTLSGHNYSDTNFGNQGRGTITVVKNVDSNGDGTVDYTDVTNWTWGYDGANGSASDLATGSSNSQAVAAGSYTVSENQKDGYHVTSSTCDNQSNSDISTSKFVTVNPGNNIVCTFTNTRDTGTITVNKTLVPSSDSGKFNLNINDTAYATDVGDGGTTGAVLLPTGTYSVSETAGTDTNLSDYTSSYQCTDGNTIVATGSGTSVDGLSVAYGHDISCTFTNTRLSNLTVVKDANPDSSQSFSFHFGSQITDPSQLVNAKNLVSDTQFSLVDNGSGSGNSQQFTDLYPGTYYVSEDSTTNWDLTDISCPGLSFTTDAQDHSLISFTLAAGADVTCTYTNTERGSIHGTKTIVNSDGSTAHDQTGISGVTINLYQGDSATGTPFATTTTDNNGDYSFTSLVPGDYTVAEVTPNGYTQIYGGGTISVGAGQDVTANNTVDFGNFENGSISGYKFNDLNGNGTYDSGEPKLSGWTINLYTGDSATPAKLYQTKVTDGDGNYSFSNLPPNNYYVCEVGQNGWVQTSTPTCYSIDLNQSNEQDTAVFGNRGYGTITVIKNVDDGFGNISQDVSGWTWDLNGNYYSNADNSASSTDTLTGLPADTYSIHEDQQTNYHFTSVTCADNGTPFVVTQAETTQVALAAGSNIVCTYTNTRDTGTLTVNKVLSPSNDNGKFNLNINGSAYATNVGDGGTTGAVLLPTGTYSVSETAGANTSLNDYASTYRCTDGETVVASGSGASVSGINVAYDHNVSCTFTNTRLATLTIYKQVDSVNQADHSASFDFSGSGPVGDFQLSDGQHQTFTDLPLGNYTVSEATTDGWTLANLWCTDESQQIVNSYEASVALGAGANVSCYFENAKLATITVTKYNDLNLNGQYDSTTQTSGLSIPEPTLPGWDMTLTNQDSQAASTQTTGNDGSTSFGNVLPGFYSLDETQQDNWNLSNIYCTNTEGGLDGPYYFDVEPGANIDCFVGNYQNPVLTINKSNNRPNPTVVGDSVTYTIVVTVPNDSGAVFDTTVTDLPPANFTYVKGSWTANSSVRGDLKAGGVTTEPTYGSPGIWQLGNLIPGEVITLTYQALIGQNVSDGSYPDIAFTNGYSSLNHEGQPDVTGGCVGSCLNSLGDPFVATKVSIITPLAPGTYTAGQVVGPEVLVNTGTSLFWLEFVLPLILIGGVVASQQASKTRKEDR